MTEDIYAEYLVIFNFGGFKYEKPIDIIVESKTGLYRLDAGEKYEKIINALTNEIKATRREIDILGVYKL